MKKTRPLPRDAFQTSFVTESAPEIVNSLRPLPEDTAAGREMVVAMITNPRSGGNRKGIGKIRELLARNPEILHREAVTPPEVNAALADFSARNVDLLVVNGGDGTVQAVLTAIYGRSIFARPPLLALLRAGTTSMLANDVGVAGEPLAALARVRAWGLDRERSENRINVRPVLKVKREGEEPLCGMFLGAGAIPLGVEIFHGSMNPNKVRGELIPGLLIARMILSVLTGRDRLFPPTEMEIRPDDYPPQRDSFLFAMVSTLERLFLGLHPFWGREAAPLHFTALKSNPPCLLRNLPFLLRGRPTASATPGNGYFSQNVEGITLDFRGNFTLDGELFEARAPLTIEPAGPARFLRI
jgi:hypothetical protein